MLLHYKATEDIRFKSALLEETQQQQVSYTIPHTIRVGQVLFHFRNSAGIVRLAEQVQVVFILHRISVRVRVLD